MVHFPGLSSPPYGFRWRYSGISLSGLPHSEILGSKPVCGSPKLFAAYHVLHRLLAPRHSPYALSSLTISNSRLTPIAGSRLAGSRVRTCRTANRELRIAACDSPLHTACVLTPPALAGAVDCGRKKLPFAGYSVVKESVVRSCRPCRRWSSLARELLSKIGGLLHSCAALSGALRVTRRNL